MPNRKYLWVTALLMLPAILVATTGICLADGPSLIDSLQYDRAIHILAMLLIGFGFLMVFLRRYGRSALTATFLLVSVTIPFYMVVKSSGAFGGATGTEMDSFIPAEFAGASLLICVGASLGRLKMFQYFALALLFVPFYMINEWIVSGNGGGLIASGAFVDTGGSIIIHAFGALFGLGVVMALSNKGASENPIESDATSDRFSMLGSMVLWVFWPSFCAALVAPELVPYTAVNVVIALCGSTLATYVTSVALRHKISITDIANAALAGGVAIGATCAAANHPASFVIGIAAGVLSTFGFAVIQPKLERALKMVDTCGVTNLHGWPGLMGGIVAIFIINGISAGNQLAGIGITAGIAIASGYLVGLIVSRLGRLKKTYDDSAEFLNA